MYVQSTLSLCQLNVPVHFKTYSALRNHSKIYIPPVIIFETENIKIVQFPYHLAQEILITTLRENLHAFQ
jgi:hypothetical protein